MTASVVTVHEKQSRAPTGWAFAHGRHPADAVRAVLATLLFAITLVAVHRSRLTTFERDIFRLINDLPNWLGPVLVVVMQAGNVAAAPLLATIALLRRAGRMAFDVLASGALAWFAAKAVKDWISRPRPGGFLDEIARTAEDLGRGYVSGHTAVAVALATAASPYLPRRWRRIAWATAWVVGAARIYEGAHLPLDIVGGAAVGWFIGSTLHVALGAPHRRPRLAEVHAALRATGLGADRVWATGRDPRGSFPFVADVGDSRYFVKLLDPEPRDRDLLYRLFRVVTYRDVRDEVALRDAAAQADHEAALTLLAREAGVRAPALLRVQAMHGAMWVVEEWIEGCTLEDAEPSDISDATLEDLWRQVALLHRAHLAHRDLEVENVMIGREGRVWIVDFAHAMSAPPGAAYDNDIAELLASVAVVVGAERAVESARAVLGIERLASAAAELQPLALTPRTRARLRSRPGLLARLRGMVGPADHRLAESPDVRLPKVRARPAAVLAACVGGTWLVAGPRATWEVLSTGSWRWYAIAAFAAAGAAAGAGFALAAGAGRPLATGRSVVAALVARTAFLTNGADGRDVVLRRYFELCGLRRGHAAAAARLLDEHLVVASSGAALALAVLAVVDDPRWAVTGAAVLLVASTAALRMVAGRADSALRHVVTQRQIRRLWGPTAVVVAGEMAALMAALEGAGATVSVAAIGVSFAAAGSASGLLRAPAGVREALTFGLLVVAGTPAAVAAVGAFAFAAITLGVPAIAGVVVAASLRHRLAP